MQICIFGSQFPLCESMNCVNGEEINFNVFHWRLYMEEIIIILVTTDIYVIYIMYPGDCLAVW